MQETTYIVDPEAVTYLKEVSRKFSRMTEGFLQANLYQAVAREFDIIDLGVKARSIADYFERVDEVVNGQRAQDYGNYSWWKNPLRKLYSKSVRISSRAVLRKFNRSRFFQEVYPLAIDLEPLVESIELFISLIEYVREGTDDLTFTNRPEAIGARNIQYALAGIEHINLPREQREEL